MDSPIDRFAFFPGLTMFLIHTIKSGVEMFLYIGYLPVKVLLHSDQLGEHIFPEPALIDGLHPQNQCNQPH